MYQTFQLVKPFAKIPARSLITAGAYFVRNVHTLYVTSIFAASRPKKALVERQKTAKIISRLRLLWLPSDVSRSTCSLISIRAESDYTQSDV